MSARKLKAAMLPSILLLAGACLAAPFEALGNCKEQTINLNGPYSMPLTYQSNSSYCSYKFIVPPGQFAYANIVVYNLSNDANEMVFVTDVDNLIKVVFHANDVVDGLLEKWNNTAAWPQSFIFRIQPGMKTQIKYQIDVTLHKNLLGQNVKGSSTVDTDGPSALFYFEDLLEGQTYNIISTHHLVDLKRVIADWTNYYALNNVFVYDSGALIGTLYSDGDALTLPSITNVIQLYVAKSIVELTKGAVLATDSSNVANLNYHDLEYVPVTSRDHSQQTVLIGDDTRAGALTIIGEKHGSTFDVRQLVPLDDNTASFSYNTDGPMKSNSTWTPLNPKRLPKQFHGNLNTFYIGSGKALIKYTLV